MDYVNLGIDLGQRVDPSAVCATEHHAGGYRVRYAARLPLGMAYTDQADRLHELVQRCREKLLREAGGGTVHVWVDITGVGRPVVDMLRPALDRDGELTTSVLHPCTFASSTEMEWKGWEVRVGKAYMVARLQSLLENGRLQFADTPEIRQLAQELADYEVRVSDGGRDTYGARSGRHDDLASALMLSTLAPRTAQVWSW